MELHLLQSQVALRLGVHKASIQNWERGIGVPTIAHLPAIIDFLGFDPEPEPVELKAKIAYVRRKLGWTQKDLAKALAVDSVTVYRWEAGISQPPNQKLRELEKHLHGSLSFSGLAAFAN